MLRYLLHWVKTKTFPDRGKRPPASCIYRKALEAILTPIPVVLKHGSKGLGLPKPKNLVTHPSRAAVSHATGHT